MCIALVKVQFTVTRGGYEAAERRFSAADLEVSVSGRSFIITGANSGIGKAAAYEIAKRGENKNRTKTTAINFYSLITDQLGRSCTFCHLCYDNWTVQQKAHNSDSYWQMMFSATKNHSNSKFFFLQAGQYICCAEIKIVRRRQKKRSWSKVKMR